MKDLLVVDDDDDNDNDDDDDDDDDDEVFIPKKPKGPQKSLIGQSSCSRFACIQPLLN